MDSGLTCASGVIAKSTITPNDRLVIPYRKRLSHSYVLNEEGVRELRLDYGMKEITFDEPHLFAWGEALVEHGPLSFTGEDSIAWGPGYAWDEIQPLLETLLDEGVLRRGDHVDDPRGGGLVASPLPPSQCPVARSWSLAECEAITRDLAGRAIEIGNLETFVASFRVAHPALDADDRQVGEANVFPAKLRIDRETEWRVCQYSGSRYRDELPMNVTALRAMIKHWKPMMIALGGVRDELARRLDLGRGPWTIGELHTLACVVLGLPAYQLMLGGGDRERRLHPVMSSLFRITDGIRMVTSGMLFSIERTRRADEPLAAAEMYDFVEMNGVFIGRTGVCAGPKPLVDEFLAIALDGAAADGLTGVELPGEVAELMRRLPAAIDYGLLGLQTWGVTHAVWLAMSRAYQAVAALLDTAGAATAAPDTPIARLRAALRADLEVFDRLQINLLYDQDVHLKFYLDAYERSWRAMKSPIGPARLADAIAAVPAQPAHRVAADQLRQLLAARLSARTDDANRSGGPDVASIIEPLVDAVTHYLREEQGILAATERLQAAINGLLDRPPATRPVCVRDIRAIFLMAPRVTRFPYLFDVLDSALGIRVDCTAHAIEISERSGR